MSPITKNRLVLCPLSFELEAILARLRESKFVCREEQVGPLKVFHVVELNLILSLAGHGKTQFGIQTQFLLNYYANIESVFCAGCAGGIDERLSVLDVVVAEKTIEHDFKLHFVARPLPEFSGDPSLLKKFSKLHTEGFRIHIGKIASGDEDIIDPARANQIKLQTQALAVAWEGAGGARACKFNSIPFIEIRGITDLANLNAKSDFRTNLKLAMAHVCDALLQVLK